MREVDQRFGIIESGCNQLVDNRSPSHKKHIFEQMTRQRVYQMAAGYEDSNDTDYLRIDLVREVFLNTRKSWIQAGFGALWWCFGLFQNKNSL